MFQQALANGSRSTVLKPLGWLVGLTITGTIAAYRWGSRSWFANTLGGLCVVSIVLYVLAYIYFAVTDKDSLRSEKYSIQKMAIQKGFIGDDQTGYIPIPKHESPNAYIISSPESEQKGDEQ